jgi:tetratricopeptide (TPR) repeat protein
MKRILILLLSVLVLASCASKKKMMVNQRYDEAIEKCVKSLTKDRDDEDDARTLDQAYTLANERDQARVKFLRQEGNPDTYDELFALYSQLKYRQARVRTVLPLKFDGRTVNYPQIDYDSEIITAKKKAAEYYYNNGKRLMAENRKETYREAFYQLRRAQEYSGGTYPDAEKLINEARLKGISRALIEIENRTQFRLPNDFIGNVLSFNTDNLNSEWVLYYITDRDRSVQFDYIITINLQSIDVSPDRVTSQDNLIKKEVDDGFSYALDAKGNVLKDTSGNDIKIKKTKTLTCTLIETTQQKSAFLKGEVEFMSLIPDQKLIKKEPIGAETHFEFRSARAVGDIQALNQEEINMTKSKPAPFPTDFEMIGRCTETMSNAVRDVVVRNRQLVY